MVRQLEATSSALMSVRKDLEYFKTQRNPQEVLDRHLQYLSDAMPGVRTLSVLDAEGKVLGSNRRNWWAAISQTGRLRESSAAAPGHRIALCLSTFQDSAGRVLDQPDSRGDRRTRSIDEHLDSDARPGVL